MKTSIDNEKTVVKPDKINIFYTSIFTFILCLPVLGAGILTQNIAILVIDILLVFGVVYFYYLVFKNKRIEIRENELIYFSSLNFPHIIDINQIVKIVIEQSFSGNFIIYIKNPDNSKVREIKINRFGNGSSVVTNKLIEKHIPTYSTSGEEINYIIIKSKDTIIERENLDDILKKALDYFNQEITKYGENLSLEGIIVHSGIMAYPKLINKCGYYYALLFEVKGKGYIDKSLQIDIVLYKYGKIHEQNYKEYYERLGNTLINKIKDEILNTDFRKCEYIKKEKIPTYYME